MYNSANQYRLDKVKSLNANFFLTDPHNAFKEVEKASKGEGYYFIHPFDGKFTIQGTASLGFEICQQMKIIDNIIIFFRNFPKITYFFLSQIQLSKKFT